MISLIGNLLINSYTSDGYKIQVTTNRAGALVSIQVEDTFDSETKELFTGNVAQELYSELLTSRLAKEIGAKEKLNLLKFAKRGIIFVESNEVN